jgi:hypothetical protein
VNEDSNHIPNFYHNTCKWLQDLWLPYILVRVWLEYQYSSLVGCDAVSLLGEGGDGSLPSQEPSNASRIIIEMFDPAR